MGIVFSIWAMASNVIVAVLWVGFGINDRRRDKATRRKVISLKALHGQCVLDEELVMTELISAGLPTERMRAILRLLRNDDPSISLAQHDRI